MSLEGQFCRAGYLWEGRGQVPAALAALGLGWAGLSGAPSLAVPAGAGCWLRQEAGPSAPPPLHCGGSSSARTLAEPGWGAHGAGTAGAGRPRSRAGTRTGRRSGCAGSRRWRRRQHPLYLRFPSASFSLLSFFPLFFGRPVSPPPPTEEL